MRSRTIVLAAAVERWVAEIRSLREPAERQEQKAAEALTRIRSEYKAGELTAAEWREFRDEITGEQKAAAAEAERLRRQEQAATDASELQDAESGTLQQLADLRRTFAAEVVESRALEAVRAALARLFVSFTLSPVEADAPETDAVLDAVDRTRIT